MRAFGLLFHQHVVLFCVFWGFSPLNHIDNGNRLSFILFSKPGLIPGSSDWEASREAGSLGTH